MLGMRLAKLGEGLIQGKHVVTDAGRGNLDLIELDTPQASAAFPAGLSSSLLDQNPPHRLGAAAKKCPRLSQDRSGAPSTSRIYASCTSAVACSVCPGFSWASFAAASFRSSS